MPPMRRSVKSDIKETSTLIAQSVANNVCVWDNTLSNTNQMHSNAFINCLLENYKKKQLQSQTILKGNVVPCVKYSLVKKIKK